MGEKELVLLREKRRREDGSGSGSGSGSGGRDCRCGDCGLSWTLAGGRTGRGGQIGSVTSWESSPGGRVPKERAAAGKKFCFEDESPARHASRASASEVCLREPALAIFGKSVHHVEVRESARTTAKVRTGHPWASVSRSRNSSIRKTSSRRPDVCSVW